MHPQFPPDLEWQARIAVEVTERGQDRRMDFDGVDGVLRGLCYRQRILYCPQGPLVNGEVKEAMETFELGVGNRDVWERYPLSDGTCR